MITEDYVSFETAKLLKEKGFDEPCYQCYVLFDKFVETSYYEFAVNSKLIKFERLYADEQPLINSKGFRDFINNKDKSRVFAAPTLQMAIKWLREVYNLFVFPFPQINTNRFWTEIFQLSDNQEWENLYCESIDLQDYSTYEEACDAGIKYCLKNLI